MRVLVVLVACIPACGRIGFEGSGSGSADAGPADLVVTIPEDRLDLGSDRMGLSLREAVKLAAMSPGADRITFDPTVFPPATTPTEIALGSTLHVASDTTIDGTGAGVQITEAANDLTLIEVDGNNVTLEAFAEKNGDIGVHAANVSNLRLESVSVTSTAAEAFLLESAKSSEIHECRVVGAGPAPIHVVGANDVTIDGTFVSLSTKSGVVYGIRVENSSAMHVTNNTVDPGSAWMISFDGVTSSEIVGNIIDGGDTGIALTGATSNITVFRNVVIMTNVDSVFVDTGVNDTQVVNNTFFMIGDITDGGTGTTTKNDLISFNAPDFVDPGSYDFHLVTGSTSIDAAVDVGQDMLPDQPARFLGKGPDLGAVESF